MFSKQTATVTDPRLKWLLGDQSQSAQDSNPSQPGEAAAPESDHEADNPSTDAAPSGKLATGRPSGTKSAQGPAPPRNPASYKYDYQTLMEQGRNLSTRTSFAATPLSMPSTDSDIPAPMPHATKDPIAPIGMGNQRRSMYGPDGASSSYGSTGSGPSSAPTGPGYLSGMPSGPYGGGTDSGQSRTSSGYISNSTLPQLPKFNLHMSKPTGPAALPDASSRTYDPGRGY
jgi:hypothetical protein